MHITTATTAALSSFLGCILEDRAEPVLHLCHSSTPSVSVYEAGGAPICSDQLMRAFRLSQPPP